MGKRLWKSLLLMWKMERNRSDAERFAEKVVDKHEPNAERFVENVRWRSCETCLV